LLAVKKKKPLHLLLPPLRLRRLPRLLLMLLLRPLLHLLLPPPPLSPPRSNSLPSVKSHLQRWLFFANLGANRQDAKRSTILAT
jgi:hypothetical protein